VQLDQHGSAATGAVLIRGEHRRTGEEPAFPRPPDEPTGFRSVGTGHEDAGRPLHVAAGVLPLIDRAVTDRQVTKDGVEELEAAMRAGHSATLTGGPSLGPSPEGPGPRAGRTRPSVLGCATAWGARGFPLRLSEKVGEPPTPRPEHARRVIEELGRVGRDRDGEDRSRDPARRPDP